ncbi:Serum response factor-binding protein [Dirofilaria immitis]
MRNHKQYKTILAMIWIACITINSVSSSIQYTRETMPGAQYYDGKKLNIPISKEAGIELFERWTHQGISSIMSCIATQYLSKVNEYERNRLQKCSNAAENIHEQARCLVRAFDAKPKQIDPTRIYHIQKLLDDGKQKTPNALNHSELHHIDATPDAEAKQVELNTRRSVINRRNYKLHTEYENLTPFGILGKYLSKMTKIVKNKDPNSSWKKILHDIECIKRQQEKNEQLRNQFPLNQYFGNVKPELKAKLGISDHVVQGLGKNNMTTKKALEIAQLFRRAIKLAMVLSGANGTELENKTLRFGSPRLLSMTPDDANDQISEGLEALTSIPKLMKTAGNRDYEEWLNFIIEASGTTDAIDKLKVQEKQELDWIPPAYKSMPRGIDGQPLYFTKENVTEIDPELARKMELFENLTHSLTSEQLAEFNTIGFSMMTPKQLMMFYGPQSPLNDSKSLEFFMSLSEDDMHRLLISDIRKLAQIRLPRRTRPKRQTILTPSAFTNTIFSPGEAPSILSPSAFSITIFSPSVFGSSILSPSVFTASILSPSLLGPAILSPASFGPVVLSPSSLNPLILSPGALSPSILSPTALSPIILSSYALSPSIMSPFALNPFIFSTFAITSLIASPFLLSPSFFSPTYVSSVIFSPNAFSPLFNSTGKNVTVLFSPSVGS